MRQAAGPEFPADWPHHGKTYGYKTGCRCQPCVDAYRERRREYKARHRANAGRPKTCRACGSEYHYSSDPSHGTVYCASCRRSGVEAAYLKGRLLSKPRHPCSICSVPCASSRRYQDCDECHEKLPQFLWDSLMRHRAPMEFVLRVWLDPSCDICGKRLDMRYRDSRGRLRGDHAIDHDHSCCQGSASCGQCIRGLLCRNCNAGIGYMSEDPRVLARASEYISSPFQPWKNRLDEGMVTS